MQPLFFDTYRWNTRLSRSQAACRLSRALCLVSLAYKKMTLEIRGLKRDLGDKVVLTDINLTVNKGDIVFVRGPSGVGKSLLLRAIACLDCVQVIAEL